MTDLNKKILNDIRVELSEEFDRNFQKKAFFDRPWPNRKSRGNGSLLMVSGKLRRSIRCSTGNDSVTWETSEAYAYIHNFGGTITVTAKMKRFFWYKFKATANAEWKWMALMKVGAKITIPQRQFIGDHPQVRRMVERIVNDNLTKAAQELVKRLV